MNVCLSVAASIECSLNQVLLHWSANLVLILVELKQSLRQLSVVQSLWLEEISHDSLVIALLDEAHDALLVVDMTLVAECLTESKLLDILEELFFKVGSRNIVWSIEESEHVLEHTASRTRSRYELHNLVTLSLIFVPSLLEVFHFLGCRSHDSLTDGSRTLELEEWETILDLFQLVFNLLLGDAVSSDLVKILLIHNTIFMLNLHYMCYKDTSFF